MLTLLVSTALAAPTIHPAVEQVVTPSDTSRRYFATGVAALGDLDGDGLPSVAITDADRRVWIVIVQPLSA